MNEAQPYLLIAPLVALAVAAVAVYWWPGASDRNR
jgi:hypothetical protein